MEISINIQYGLVLICVAQCRANFQEDPNFNFPGRESEIERAVPIFTQLGFTTRDYGDIDPLSIDVDGAPQCAPVVYASDDFDKDEQVDTNDEVKKLREEFWKKHRKDNVPDETKNVANKYEHEINYKADEKREMKNNNLRETVREDLGNQRDLNQNLNEVNKVDLQRYNNIVKQHWNADNEQEAQGKGENLPKQHWNREPMKKQYNEDKKFTLFPEVDNEDVGKNDNLQKEFHEQIYGDDDQMGHLNQVETKPKKKIELKKISAEVKAIQQNVHKVHKINGQLKNLLKFDINLDNTGNLNNYKKLMEIEVRQTTNPHQKEKVYGPACKLKFSNAKDRKNILKINEKAVKHNRRKRNVKSTHQIISTRHAKPKKTTKYFMHVDGCFRDIEEVERERNQLSSEEEKGTQPDWVHDDGYRPKTARKFRPRPPLNFNREPKEPLDYGSYDKSEFWRMMTEYDTNTLPPKFYQSMSMPELPDTKEAYDVCRENFTTSECFRYPDISRLRETQEKKFMKKYYNKEYPDLD